MKPRAMNIIKIPRGQFCQQVFLCDKLFRGSCRIMECCLCKLDVSVGQGLKKRKKLSADQAEVARTLLQKLCQQEFGVRMVEESSFLCGSCDTQLCRLAKLEQEIESLRRSVVTKVCSLQLCTSTSDHADHVVSSSPPRSGPLDSSTTSIDPDVMASVLDSSISTSHEQTPETVRGRCKNRSADDDTSPQVRVSN